MNARSKRCIAGKLTRRDCVSVVYQIFDPLGKITPITSGLQIDLHELTLRKLDWDDEIPDNLKAIWSSNFEMIKELPNVRYHRAVVPHDAVNLDMETIVSADIAKT